MVLIQTKMCVLVTILILLSQLCSAELVVSHNISKKKFLEGDFDYELKLLILGLEYTKDEYGDYRIEPIRDDMSYIRRIERMSYNHYTNFITAMPYQDNLSEDANLVYAPFPVFLGVLGYRTCFTSAESNKRLASVKNTKDLLTFTHGQVRGELDVEILKNNGFVVKESSSYMSLFRMVAVNRFDLFCRNPEDALAEYNYHQKVPNFIYNRDIAIHYPMPYFFYGHVSDRKLIERINKGLVRAFNSGSVVKLWKQHFQENIDFIDLKNRKLYPFENHLLEHLDDSYIQYVYAP